MIKAGVLFGGFGGVEIGMFQAGITPVWSIEKNLGASTVAEMNFDHKVICADILDVDPHTLESVDILHASPPCPRFSLANATGRGETEEDIALARKTAQFAKILRPKIFTLENVWLYRKSESWRVIRDSLYEAGYWLDVAHINCADYGVPQTRKRMIVRAVLGGFVPYLPRVAQWRGWYEAIKDLIPGLPDSQFAPWQLARLPDELKSFVVANGCYEDLVIREVGEPIFTVTGNSNQTGVRAFLVMTGNTNKLESDCVPGRGILYPDRPANTVTTYSNGQTPRAFIQTRSIEQCPHRAFIVGQNYGNGNDGNAPRKLNIREAEQPIFTIETNSNRLKTRAWLSCGRVVSMTVRALARFQSFPDSYSLPDSNKLACYGIGNAVPPLAYQKIIGGLIEASGLPGGG